jgi:apolipoprotein N-acyltransferase
MNLSGKKSEKIPNIIVWGETASPFVLDRDDFHLDMLRPILAKGVYLVTGMVSFQEYNGGYVPSNSLVVFDNKARAVGYYHKTHLVPFGEFIPLRKYLPDFIKPVANAVGEFKRGKGPEVLKFEGLPSFGGIICYEVIFPSEVVDKNNRPEFLINLTNDGWYGVSSGPYQHWVAAKLRAVEEGIQIVRVANNGISGLINSLGVEKERLELNEKGYLDVVLDKKSDFSTLYGKTGNSLIISFCLILLFYRFISIVCKKLINKR